jgi:hypothetical protein
LPTSCRGPSAPTGPIASPRVDTLPQKLQGEGRALLTKIPYAERREKAERQKGAFQAWATRKGVPAAGRRLAEDWDRLVTF